MLVIIKQLIKNIYYKTCINYYKHKRYLTYNSFDFNLLKNAIIKYLDILKHNKYYEYRFSIKQKEPDLYSSVYAILILGLLGEVDNMNPYEKKKWANYLLSFQNQDGLFRDSRLNSNLSGSCHYWGWHHLAPHMIIALDYLGAIAKYDFNIILNNFKNQSMSSWLENRNWSSDYLTVSNEIMNIGVMLQYSRDNFLNKKASALVEELKTWLIRNKRDSNTSLWGYNTNHSIYDISKAIKAAYHIIPLFYYDKEENKINIKNILKYTIKTQNKYFSFSPNYFSDACEDMDSSYILSILKIDDDKINNKIKYALKKYLDMVFINFNKDGGFVFRRLNSFQYADQPLLSSLKNQSNIFGTWFRLLSIAYCCKYLNVDNNFKFSNVPGYQFYRG